MFVMLIGLLGVAAMIPAGRSEILAGSKVDQANMVGRAAFRDLKIRGYLNPGATVSPFKANWQWYDVSAKSANPAWDYTNPATPFVIGGSPSNQAAVAIDPLGSFAAANFGQKFPSGATGLYLTRVFPSTQFGVPANAATGAALADPVFRSAADLILTPSAKGRDYPPEQLMMGSGAKRSSDGNYSWIATVVSDPTQSALLGKVTVSVAVFFKRDLSNPSTAETSCKVGLSSQIIYTKSSSGVFVPSSPVDIQILNPPKPVRPGQWIMLAGTMTRDFKNVALPVPLSYAKWYRVVAADSTDASSTAQFVTLSGPDWPVLPPQSNNSANTTTAWLFDNIVTVYEKNMRLEVP